MYGDDAWKVLEIISYIVGILALIGIYAIGNWLFT